MLELKQVIENLAGGYSLRTDGGDGHDPPEYWMERRAGQVSIELICQLIREGWVEGYNGGYRLTDAGHLAYMRSTDELGDGVLRAPASEP